MTGTDAGTQQAGTGVRRVDIRPGTYADSIGLMQISQELQQRDGVRAALVAMATELNLELLATMQFDPPSDTSPNDMVVAIEGDDDAAVEAAVAALDAALVRRPTGGHIDAGQESPPSTIEAAVRGGGVELALVSTPGRFATIDAAAALDAELDVMIFSDNVSVEQEVALKERAGAAGRLVMGPDCGTAVVDGVGLGFANVVRPGPVGIVAASGTGAQHLMALLDGADIGVTHCIGVGGRDLSSKVQGRSTHAALDRLATDERIEVIVVVSKPPADDVRAAVTAHAGTLAKPTVLGYLGAGLPDLTETAASVARAVGDEWSPPPRWGPVLEGPRPGQLRGLFAGGTLCDEAMLVAVGALGTVSSNIPLAGQHALDESLAAHGHTFIDFGDDRLTVGRPHPMIDATLRLERLKAELADPECAVVLLDVVLGRGAHPDPATDLVDVLATSGSDTPVVVSLVGTRDDPQARDGTARRLAAAGAVVHASNAAAAREAVGLLAGGAR